MEWREDGILLAVRRHGESSAIIEVLTKGHGRHSGIVRGGASRKIAPLLQPGTELDLTWRARLEDHLGGFTAEPKRARAAALMGDRLTLAGLNAMVALLSFALPEREAHPGLYEKTCAVLDMMEDGPYWPLAYLQWELTLLQELGFGLDLSRCAVTGTQDDLRFISPKSGKAVSSRGAGEWAERLLPLSPTLLGQWDGSSEELMKGLKVTGHFLTTWLAPALGNKPIPDARVRLLDLLGRS